MLCQGQGKHPDPSQDGQHYNPHLHKQLGGTASQELNHLTKDLWTWCLSRNISLQATHLAGIRNITADEESRVMKDRSDWMLCPRVFNKINQVMGPLQVDLFASRLTHQLQDFVSWRPDPEAMATDAFTLDWKQFRGYANLPWSLVGRVQSQVKKAQLVLVAPIWKSQIWYPTLLGMVMQEPLLLPASPELIQPTHRVNKPNISPTLAARAKIPTQSLSAGASRLLLSSWRQKNSQVV